MTPPARQRVVMLQKFGGPEGLLVVERPVPEPGPGEVLVRVLAASVQFTDVLMRKGRYPDLKERPPLILGYDLVGEIVKVGPLVTSPKVGERVADLTMTGSYVQYRTLAIDRATIVDPALDPAEATSLVLTWLTAYQLLHRDAGVEAGQKLLVVGASGAVGQALVVLGKIAGCEVWGAARARHADLVRALGATPLDIDQADLAQVRSEGFDVVFDGIGQQGFSHTWRAVGPRGHLSAFGFTDAIRTNTRFALLGFWLARLWWWNTFSGGRTTSFFSITATRRRHPDWFRTDLDALLVMLAGHAIRPVVSERIGLDAVADAHARLERGGLEGKIVLVPNP